MVKNPPANAGNIRDMDSIPGLGRSLGEGHGNPLQCSCLDKPMDRGTFIWGGSVGERVVADFTQSETATTLFIDYSPILNKQFEKKRVTMDEALCSGTPSGDPHPMRR